MRAITLGLARRPSFSKIPRPLATRIENTTSSLAPADAIAAAQARRSSMSSTLAFAITTCDRSGKCSGSKYGYTFSLYANKRVCVFFLARSSPGQRRKRGGFFFCTVLSFLFFFLFLFCTVLSFFFLFFSFLFFLFFFLFYSVE